MAREKDKKNDYYLFTQQMNNIHKEKKKKEKRKLKIRRIIIVIIIRINLNPTDRACIMHF